MNAKTDLLLLYPPWAALGSRGTLQNGLPPLGLLSIAAYAQKEGFRVSFVDVHAERLTEEDVSERLRQAAPRVVGISVLTHGAIPAHALARLAKKVVPSAIVIVGGAHAEVLPEEMLGNSSIDAVVSGDGEEATVEVLRGDDFSTILGLSYRDGRRVVHGLPRPIQMTLDAYPMPAYELIDFGHYLPAVGSYRRLPAMNMVATRGCVGRCTFCNSASTTVRAHSPARVVAQIKRLRDQYGVRQIQFYDDTFTVLRDNVQEICDRLVADRIDVTWTAYIRGDRFDAHLASAMRNAGCHQVLIGVESGDDRIAKSIGKPIDKAVYKEAVAFAHEQGIEVRASFIIGHIGETNESMEATLDFAKNLDVDMLQLGILTPLPGTEVFRQAVEQGLLIHTNWHEYGNDRVLLNLPTITAEDIYRFERHAFRSFYLRPIILLRQLRRMTTFRQVKDLVYAFLLFLVGANSKGERKWDCWLRYNLASFQDIDLVDTAPQVPRLTSAVRRQGAGAEKQSDNTDRQNNMHRGTHSR